MRITNTMMTNNTMRNVNKSKNTLYTKEEQMSTQKKISKPSDDPIVAIRALSLRTTITEVEQYLKKNVPDAKAWISLTETSLNNVDGLLQEMYGYCNQGSSDSFTTDNRQAIIDAIDQLKNAIYAEGNADSAGRYIFTGYRTDNSLTFQSSERPNDKKYKITQKFTSEEITTAKYMKNSVKTDINSITKIDAADTPKTIDAYRIRLAYSDCSKDANTISIKIDDNDMSADKIKVVALAEYEELISKGDMQDDAVYYIHDKGELVFNKAMRESMEGKNIEINYQKDQFDTGDLKPEHYFNCVDISDPNKEEAYVLGANQDIEYTINFSQSLKVNTRATQVLSYNIGRDLDDLENSLSLVADIESKIEKLKQMKQGVDYSDKQEELDSMIKAAEKELDYAKNNMENLFGKGMTQIKGYQNAIYEELADVGSREIRLTCTETRLKQQQTTFKDLKSKNEDIELEDISIDYASAKLIYDAAIATASKTVKQTLLDYI